MADMFVGVLKKVGDYLEKVDLSMDDFGWDKQFVDTSELEEKGVPYFPNAIHNILFPKSIPRLRGCQGRKIYLFHNLTFNLL